MLATDDLVEPEFERLSRRRRVVGVGSASRGEASGDKAGVEVREEEERSPPARMGRASDCECAEDAEDDVEREEETEANDAARFAVATG